jgi:hypothetical protein
MHKPTYEAIAKEINIDPHNYNGENPCDLDNLKVKTEIDVSITNNKSNATLTKAKHR